MSGIPETITRFEAIEAALAALTGAGWTVGDMRLFPFRTDELPDGWYHMNGDRYALTSPQGEVINGFSAAYKSDWAITVMNSTINLPSMYAADGRPYFERAVDGVTRLPGSEEGDAIRNIVGFDASLAPWIRTNEVTPNDNAFDGPTGAFFKSVTGRTNQTFSFVPVGWCDLVYNKFDASLAVPTAAENRPLNVGKTPAVYLGV